MSASARSRSRMRAPVYFTLQSTRRCRPLSRHSPTKAAIHRRNVGNQRNRLGLCPDRRRGLEEFMRFLVRTVLALVAAALTLCGAARAAEQVDLLLVLASDVSRS